MSEEKQQFMKVDTGAGRQEYRKVSYPSNSRKSQKETPAKEVKQVVTGPVVQRKKGFMARLGSSFSAGGSSDGTFFDYIVMEVLIPAAKNMVVDALNTTASAFTQGIERRIFGDVRKTRGERTAYTNYSKIAKPAASYGQYTISQRARAQHEFDDIIIESRTQAEDVLDQLRELIAQYGVATVADLYSLCGITDEFPDNKWGWDDLTHANVRLVRGGYMFNGGYMLNLPRTMPLEL